MFQESFLFADTVRRTSRSARSCPTRSLWKALDIARARTFVERLLHRLDEVVGERGVTLSGGSGNAWPGSGAAPPSAAPAPDDATSAVDPRIEQAILAGLRGPATTSLIVAHRVSTIALADRVLLLEGGRIVADGTHQELLAAAPAYAALVRAYEEDAGVTALDDHDAAVEAPATSCPPGGSDPTSAPTATPPPRRTSSSTPGRSSCSAAAWRSPPSSARAALLTPRCSRCSPPPASSPSRS